MKRQHGKSAVLELASDDVAYRGADSPRPFPIRLSATTMRNYENVNAGSTESCLRAVDNLT